MANAILNFHFDFLNPSLRKLHRFERRKRLPDIEKEYFIYFYIELIIGLISLIRSSDTAASCDKKCRLDPISFNFAAQGYHQRHPPVLFLGATLFLPFFCVFLLSLYLSLYMSLSFYFLSLIRSRSTLRCTAITNGTQRYCF